MMRHAILFPGTVLPVSRLVKVKLQYSFASGVAQHVKSSIPYVVFGNTEHRRLEASEEHRQTGTRSIHRLALFVLQSLFQNLAQYHHPSSKVSARDYFAAQLLSIQPTTKLET